MGLAISSRTFSCEGLEENIGAQFTEQWQLLFWNVLFRPIYGY
jgi:hypothetical protein